MNSLLSYSNHVRADQLSLPGDWQSITSGALANLVTPQLSDVVVVRATGRGPFEAFGDRLVRHAAQITWATAPTPPGPVLPVGLVGAMACHASTDLGPVPAGDLAVFWLVNGGGGFPSSLGSTAPIWPAQFPRNVWGAPAAETNLHTVSLIVLHLGSTGAHMDLQLGGFWVGPTFRPARGLKSTWALDPIPGAETGDPDAVVSRGGQAFAAPAPIRRRFAGQWAPLSSAEAHGVGGSSAADWQSIGVSTRGRPVVMIPRLRVGTDMTAPPDPHVMLRLGVYGLMQSGGGLASQVGLSYGTRSFTVDETL